jgi:GT2 family glycosyltransferase
MAVTSAVWQEIGPFTEELTYFGLESEWFERAREQGVMAWYVPGATVYHEHAISINRADDGKVRVEATANRKWYAKKKGWFAVAGLGLAVWLEEKFR